MASPSIREFSRIDDAAIFIDDTFDAETVRSIAGTSPSAVVMLSPQRMPVDRNGYSPAKRPSSDSAAGGGSASKYTHSQGYSHHHADGSSVSMPTTYVSGLSDSARKRPYAGGNRLFGTDLATNGSGTPGGPSAKFSSNNSSTANTNIRSFGSRLCFSACTTPKDPRKGSSLVRPSLLSRRASSAGETASVAANIVAAATTTVDAACSPAGPSSLDRDREAREREEALVAEILKGYVPLEDYERLEKERNRYREMYRYQAQLCEELTKRESEAQAALQEKIIEIIALSSRNEESKRFIRQMKREMQECRERALPFLNRKLDEIRVEQSIKEKYETMMRSQEAVFDAEKAELEKEMGALEALLKDSRCAAGMGKNSDSLLRASYLKNTRMFNDLYHTRRERDAEMDRRLELEKQLEGLRRERREAELTLTRERRAHCLREEQLIEDVHVMHEEVMQLTSELLEAQLRRDAEAQAEADAEAEARAMAIEEAEAAEREGAYVEGVSVDGPFGNDDDDGDESGAHREGDAVDDEDEEDFRPTIVEEEYNAARSLLAEGDGDEEGHRPQDKEDAEESGALHRRVNRGLADELSTRTPPFTASAAPPRPGRRPLAIPQ